MENIADRAIFFPVALFIGYLITVLFKKLHINIKHPILFSLILWCIGMGIGLSPVSNYFWVIGFISLIIGSSFGFYSVILYFRSRNKPLKTSKTEKFATSITKWTLRKIYGEKRH